ncbi:MAG: hypothetical protein LBG72_04245 [Spirochaetaceae bacterium]|jgi:hypothetical protein|nr:hypothetical protein [Spirochaetaceae bacterium]
MAYPADNFKNAIGNRGLVPRNGGRPKKLSKKFIKDNRLSRADAALLLKNSFLTFITELADPHKFRHRNRPSHYQHN